MNQESGSALAKRLGEIPAPPRDTPVSSAVIRARRTAAVGEIGLLGSQAGQLEQTTAHVDLDEHSCVLQPGADQLSWAMYAFPDLLPEDLPMLLTLYPLGEQPSGPCYVGLSDFNRGTWDWLTIDIPQHALPVPVR